MRLGFLILYFLIGTSQISRADANNAFLGIWGTDQQCSQSLLKRGGTVRAKPFELRPGWIRQGDLWCRLSWVTRAERPTGQFASSLAICGEDSVQTYRLDMSLSGEILHLIWNETLINGPMKRCSPPE